MLFSVGVSAISKIEKHNQIIEDHLGNGQILIDQLRILFSHIIANVMGSLVMMITFLWLLDGSFTTNVQYYWAAALVFLFLVRIYLYFSSLKSYIHLCPNKWLISYTGLLFVTGCLWGSAIFIPMDLMDNGLQFIIIIMLLLALASISSISSSAHPISIWAFLIPVSISASYLGFTSQIDEFSYVLGFGPLFFMLAAGLIGLTIHKIILSALILKVRNSSLMDEILSIAKKNQKSYENFQLLLDNLDAGAAMFDKNQKIISWNKSFENIFNVPIGLLKRGMGLKEIIRKVIKQSWNTNIDVNHAADVHIKDILSSTKEHSTVKLILGDGRNLYNKVIHVNNQLVLNYTDVTLLEQARTDDIIHVLQHDSLTGLPNKILYKREIKRRIEVFRDETKVDDLDHEQFMGLIHFGLNSLSEIYEFLGLNAGDQVVTEAARRCKEFLGDDVYLSHIGYDEFHIVTSREKNIDEVKKLIEKLRKVLNEPIEIGGNSIMMTISVGVSIYPDHANDTDNLNRNAKIAFNKAKMNNDDNIVIYDLGMYSEIKKRSNLLFDIRESIKKAEFLLHYQPQIDIKNNMICGVEALLRWQHPEKGWISPANFIPLAEHTKQIIPLTEQFLPEACLQAKKWHDQGFSKVRMSVNISPFHFHEKGFAKFIQKSIEDTGIDPDYLELEITEGIIMNQTDEIIKVLHELSHMGVHLSIDDFGTGYSSLSYLRSLPVDKLKIDQSFIKNMATDKGSLSLVEAVIRLGHSFNLKVIAEGIENKEQLEQLSLMDCDQAQGYFISPPESAEVISKWISKNYI